MMVHDFGEAVGSDAALQLFLDSRDPEQVLQDRVAKLFGEEAVLYEAARRRADARARRREIFERELQARKEKYDSEHYQNGSVSDT